MPTKGTSRMIGAIIQARVNSTRLHNKALLDICGKPMLVRVIDRTKMAVENITVATPNEEIIEIALDEGVQAFQGDEYDVLDRYYHTANIIGLNDIIRITSDCPLIEPGVIDYAIQFFLTHPYPYITIAPIDGMDVEVFSMEMLEIARDEALSKEDREHVTPFMKRYTKMSIDTIEDYNKVRKMWTGKVK